MATIYDMAVSVREWPLTMLWVVLVMFGLGVGLEWFDRWLRKRPNKKRSWWRG